MYLTGHPVLWALQARCFEVENESLECQIVELQEKLNSQPASFSITTTVAEPGYSLDAVVEKLRKERVGGCCCSWVCPLHVSLSCFSQAVHCTSHPISSIWFIQRQAAWFITLSWSITVFSASPCRMRFCVTLKSCRKSLNVWRSSMRRLHSRGSLSSRNVNMWLR